MLTKDGNNDPNRIQEIVGSILPKVRKKFLNMGGVHQIGFGLKEIDGCLTDALAFRFYVDKKQSLSKISKKERIPLSIHGIATDVIPRFHEESLVSVSGTPAVNTQEYRDEGIRGGISIRNEHFDNDHPSGYGTLGVLARRVSDNALVGLTCSHIVNAASDTPTKLDTRIGQPQYWISCCCCPRGWIGNVSKATINNDLDCALIAIDDDIEENVTDNNTENKVEGFPLDISGAALPLLKDVVRKHGRSSGLTTGVITDLAYGTNHMLIERTDGIAGDAFAHHGDSGAVIVNEDDQVIGLLVSAAQEVSAGVKLPLTKGIVTLIKPIMEDLGISIAGVEAHEVTVPNRAKPWPGGQADPTLNPAEVLTSADFGFTGNVDWDLSTGASGATIVGAGGQTATAQSSISVRYDTVSASLNKTDAIIIKVTKAGNEVIRFRTIFKITSRINTSGALSTNNTKRFSARGGTTNTQAGIAVPGTNSATSFLAKAEIIYEIEPADIRWDGNGVTNFVIGTPPGVKGELVSRRQTQFNKGRQANGDPHRKHTEEANWIDTTNPSTTDDFQGAATLAPAAIYRLAEEGFDPSNLLQGYERGDYRDYLEFNDGTDWIRITPFLEWFANLTADLNGTGTVPPNVGALNDLGSGATPAKIPNQPPVLTLTSTHREFKFGETATLAATAQDPNNDGVTITWTQKDGPAVTLSSATGVSVTFPAPNDDFQFKFEAVADDGTGGLARTAGNHLSGVEEMSVNVIEWKNIGGGDPVTARNMEATFNAADFGIGAGALNWDVTSGSVNAQIIEADGVVIAPTGTHNGATTIKVRYPNRSGDLTRNQSVRISATHTGSGKSWFKRRTVIRVTVAVHPNDTRTHLIPSTLGNVGKDHFCAVKNASNMIFRATLNPAPPDAQITWNATGRAITSPSIGGDRKTAHINRNPASGLRIPIKVQVGGDDIYEGVSWIIWSTILPVPGVIGPTTFEFRPGTNRIGRDIAFNCTIQPATIITATPAVDDLPDLTGPNRTNAGVLVPAPDVVAGDAGVARGATSLAAGATRKWDVSRQIKVSTPDVAAISAGLVAFAHFIGNFPNYPSPHPVHGDSIGNDDEHDTEENNNPYTNGGVISGFDLPSLDLPHGFVNVGDTFEIRLHFREFTRVLLDNVWYRSSNYLLWRSHIKGRKVSEAVDGVDYDLDGNQTDIFWIGNGTDIALNNTGF